MSSLAGEPAEPAAGTLTWVPVGHRPDLLAAPVAQALAGRAEAAAVRVAQIDPAVADTAALADAYAVPLEVSANCVLVAGRRAGELRVAACVQLATTRADVNGLVRRWLDVRKASFLPVQEAVEASGMEYGAITPIGLPASWPVLLDAAAAALPLAVIGSGVRRSKLLLPGAALARLAAAEVIEGLAR